MIVQLSVKFINPNVSLDGQGSHCAVANVLDCNIVVSEFELQSCSFVHFRFNVIWKEWTSSSSQSWAKYPSVYLSVPSYIPSFLSIYLSIYLSISVCSHLSTHLSISFYLVLSLCLSIGCTACMMGSPSYINTRQRERQTEFTNQRGAITCDTICVVDG